MNAKELKLSRLNVRLRTQGKKMIRRSIVRTVRRNRPLIVSGAVEFLLPGIQNEAFAKAERDDFDDLLDEAMGQELDNPMQEFVSSTGKAVFDSVVSGEEWNPEAFAGDVLKSKGLDLSTTISDSLKFDLRKVLSDAFADEQSVASMKRALRESLTDWEGWKLERIVRTETNRATTCAALEGYDQSGVVEGKEWINPDPEFVACVELAGTIVPLREDFVSSVGSFAGPPAHPNCESSIAPVVDLQEAA